jgi:hypothetical protein
MLRGGPSFHMPGSTEANLNIFTDQTKKISVYAGNYRGYGDEKSFRASEFYGGIIAQPMNSLSITLEPDYLVQNTMLQYVQTVNYTEDKRYIFGEMDQKTMILTIRFNFTINPELSIEYYGQPFVSAGKYSQYKRITIPDAENFENRYHLFTGNEIMAEDDNQLTIDENLDGIPEYTIDKPDFNFQEFRSNLVIRWEYLPGSTVFFVWSQGRNNSATDGTFSYASDIKDLFNTKANNVFLIKLSYWLPLH